MQALAEPTPFHFFIAKDYILLNVETHLMEAGRIEQFNKSKRTISVQTPPPPPPPHLGSASCEGENHGVGTSVIIPRFPMGLNPKGIIL
jgi:hypothetical protein